MTRVRISAVIIVVLVAVSFFSGVWVSDRCSRLTGSAVRTEELYAEGNYGAAARQSEELLRDWEKFRRGASILLRSSKLTELDRLCARLPKLAETRSEELPAEISEIIRLLELLKNGEVPKLDSVF